MDGSLSNQVIGLMPMQQLTEALDDEDDWTGLTDAAARRKRQNRLNQRARRRRKTEKSQPDRAPHPDNSLAVSQSSHYQGQHQQPEMMQLTPESQQVLRIVLGFFHGSQTPQGSTDSTPDPRITFPLSTDHLIPLIQLNVLRATLINMSLLSLLHTIPPECAGSTAALLPVLQHPQPQPQPPQPPPSLAPTELQRRTHHAHWIDVIPLAAMRDNCIRLAHAIDADDLCSDLVGGLYDGHADCDTKGWIAWRDPWHVSGWEVTEGFLRKWGFLMEGCPQIIEASNRWRAMRGEDALVVEL